MDKPEEQIIPNKIHIIKEDVSVYDSMPLCLPACLSVEDTAHKKIKPETWNFTGILG
jgi:hypothetical protein